jgi:hypothetical protein
VGTAHLRLAWTRGIVVTAVQERFEVRDPRRRRDRRDPVTRQSGAKLGDAVERVEARQERGAVPIADLGVFTGRPLQCAAHRGDGERAGALAELT